MFGKKKTADATPDASASATPNAAPEVARKDNVQRALGQRLTRFAGQQVAAVLLAMILAALVGHWWLVLGGQANAHASRSAAQADVVSTQVAQRLSFLQQAVRGYGSLGKVVEALEDPLQRRQMEQVLEGGLPHVHRVFLFPQGRIAADAASGFELSFASLDLARRAERQEVLAPDAFKKGDQWLMQLAVPVIEPNSKEVRGSLLVIFGPQVLFDALAIQDAELGGLAQLQQKVGNVVQTVLERGVAGSAEPLVRELKDTTWQVAYQPAGDVAAPVNAAVLWGLILGPALLAAALVWLVFAQLQRALRKDAAQLQQWSQKAFAGERVKLPELGMDLFVALGDNLQRLAQAIDKRVARVDMQSREAVHRPAMMADVPVTPAAVATAPVAADALFQSNDVLDIDMLDGDEDVLGLGGDPLFPDDTGMEILDTPPLDVQVPAEIFRAYDIRGVVGRSLTPDIVRVIGRAIGSEAQGRGASTLCVGRDGRLSSAELAGALIDGLRSVGCDVIDVGQVPTPVTYFAAHYFQTGSAVMVTGSHNPPDYNGLKIMLAGETLAGDAIRALLTRIHTHNFASGLGQLRLEDVRRAYLDVILNDIAVASPLKVVVDAGNGVAGELGPVLIEELGCDVIPLHCEVNGHFPNHHPDPGQPDNLGDLIDKVRAEGADLGIAFDGDGDRIGVVTNTGRIIWPDRLLMLYAKDVVSRNPGADIIYDVKCSRRLGTVIGAFGGRPVMAKTGHSWMKAKMRETGALLAGEMSGHIFFKERWYGFDDGLYAAARLLEILGQEDRACEEVFAEFPNDLSTPEINVPIEEAFKFEVVERLAREGQFGDGSLITIDGVRVDYPDGWGLCRASNTTPNLVFRFEAENEAALARIQAVFREQLLSIEASLPLPF